MRAVALALLVGIAAPACSRAARENPDTYWKDKDPILPKGFADGGAEVIDIWVEPDGDVCTPGWDGGVVDGC